MRRASSRRTPPGGRAPVAPPPGAVALAAPVEAPAAARPLGLDALRDRAARVRSSALPALLVLGALTAIAAVRGLRALDAPLWIDEGISLGIAGQPFFHIPSVLLQDGSPPLYYLLLHLWTSAFGTSVTAAHAFSALCAIVAVPAAAWAVWPVFGAGAGLAAAAILALDPFVGLYADEVRMYSLVLLLALLATGAFLRAFILGRSRWAPAFGVAVAAVMYAHNWGLFFAAATGAAWLVVLALGPGRGRLLRDGVIGFGIALVLFAPWVPSVLDQARHTGAPWSHRPTARSLTRALTRMVGGTVPETLLFLIAGAGLVELVRRATPTGRRAVVAVLVISAITLLAAFGWSHVSSPAWALRYLIIVLAPLSLLVAAGLARTGVVAVAVLAFVALASWQGRPTSNTLEHKSNVTAVAQSLGPLPSGSLVVSPQPEQVPLLRHLLGPGVRYVTPMGTVAVPAVMDWRDALHRLRVARTAAAIRAAVARTPRGGRVLLVAPRFSHPDAPWTRLIRKDTRTISRVLRRSPRLQQMGEAVPARGSSRSTVAGRLYVVVHHRHSQTRRGRHGRHSH